MSELPLVPGPQMERPIDSRSDAERAGVHDGALGQTWREYRNILEYKAEQRRVEEECAAQKQLETQQAEHNLAREAEVHARAEYERVDAHYRLVADDKDRKPSSYSRLWGAAFVVLAFLLVVADFPLTRQIVSAMSIGTDTNWTPEQVLVSVGIVAMSLFFKLLTDPFTQPQYLMNKVRRAVLQIVSGLLFAGLLAGVVAMLILLGMFRASAIQSDTTTVTTTSGSAASAPIDTQLRALEMFRDKTFVVMGLILPIIGGIFASVGMARIHNAGRFRYLERERHRLRWVLDQTVRAKEAAEASVRAFQHDLAAVRQRASVAGGEYYVYLHAYETGYCQPDLDHGRVGMATRLRDMVEKWTAIVDQSQNLVRTERVCGTDPGGGTPPAASTEAEDSVE